MIDLAYCRLSRKSLNLLFKNINTGFSCVYHMKNQSCVMSEKELKLQYCLIFRVAMETAITDWFTTGRIIKDLNTYKKS